MKGRKLNIIYAVKSLERKGCKFLGKDIILEYAKDMGNKSWGLIDYLCHYEGFSIRKEIDFY